MGRHEFLTARSPHDIVRDDGPLPGAEVLQEPIDQPYGMRDRAFRDLSGNMIRILQVSAV